MAVSTEPLNVGNFGDVQADEQPCVPSVAPARSTAFDIALFTTYGFLNNAIICVVYGGAQDIVDSFGYPNQTTLVTFISTCASVIGPSLLLAWPLNLAGYRVRNVVSCGLGLLGLLLLAISTQAMKDSLVGMVVAMVAVFLSGLQQSLGENCACMRFRRFSKIALSCWGAGTGLAGIFPPMVYTAIKHLPLYQRFLVAIPILAFYFFICIVVYNAGKAAQQRDVARSFTEDGVRVAASGAEAHEPDASEAALQDETRSDQPNNRFAWYVITVFSAVYGLEYFIYPTLVGRGTLCLADGSSEENAYTKSWISYNIGVTISRGSIAFFEFPCLWLVCALQAINVAGWAVQVKTRFLPAGSQTGYYIQYAWMVWVGLMGGTAYANCMRAFHCSPRVPSKDRDKLINLAFAISMATILASTFLGDLLDSTILTKEIVTQQCS